jgi:hypothetical protein
MRMYFAKGRVTAAVSNVMTGLNPCRANRRTAGFTLAEVLVATLLATLTMAGLFGGISYGFVETQVSRENLRATQIILEKMEGIRLYTFDQLVSSNMFPETFSASYYPPGTFTRTSGLTYYGRFRVSDLGTGASYNPNIRLVTVSISWTNSYGMSQVRRDRQMQTIIGRYGIQNYSFYN